NRAATCSARPAINSISFRRKCLRRRRSHQQKPTTCYDRGFMIALSHVSKVFDGKRKATALEDVDLDIEKGQVVSIVGPSGSGKSTLLNLIGGLDRPSVGEIRIEGANLAALSDDDLTRVRRDKIGFVFQ